MPDYTINDLPTALQLSDHRVAIRRLSWLAFEALCQDLFTLCGPLLAQPELESDQLVLKLAAAPTLMLKLAALSTAIPETQLSAWDCDDILAICARSLSLNFIETAGLRSFFRVFSGLLQAELPAARTL
jgi:hypothetical protein